jgi:hypothetical protein
MLHLAQIRKGFSRGVVYKYFVPNGTFNGPVETFVLLPSVIKEGGQTAAFSFPGGATRQVVSPSFRMGHSFTAP